MAGTHQPEEPEIVIVTMVFDTEHPAVLADLLAHYVVMSRGHEGCRNIDLCTSIARPGRHVVIEKWESAHHQQVHFDSPEMVAMAEGCRDLLSGPPDIDLLAGISAHDLN